MDLKRIKIGVSYLHSEKVVSTEPKIKAAECNELQNKTEYKKIIR